MHGAVHFCWGDSCIESPCEPDLDGIVACCMPKLFVHEQCMKRPFRNKSLVVERKEGSNLCSFLFCMK